MAPSRHRFPGLCRLRWRRHFYDERLVETLTSLPRLLRQFARRQFYYLRCSINLRGWISFAINSNSNPYLCPPSRISDTQVQSYLANLFTTGKVGETLTITLPMGKRKLKIVELVTVHQLASER